MTKTILDNPLNSLTQSNKLVRASYKLSLPEKRLFILAASKINPENYLQDWSFTVTAKEWEKIYGSNGNSYKDMEKAAKLLMRQPILTIKDENDKYEEYHWVSYARYRKSEGAVDLEIPTNLRRYLADLLADETLQGFTTYKLINVGKIDSFYAIRLYEIFYQFLDMDTKKGWLKISPEEIIETLELPPSYQFTSSLIRRVIEPSLKQINDKSNLKCSFDICGRQGRKISMLEFKFKEKKTACY